MSREEEERAGISGGRFIHPGYLPPTRETRLEAIPGKDMPYHFGKKAYPVSAISAVTIGTCWIQSIQFYIVGQDSSPVVAIPEGSLFYMKFHYRATNTKGSATDVWSVSVVYWEGSDPVSSPMKGHYFDDTFDDAGALLHPTYLENTPSTNQFTMPARDVTFNFNMFINDDHAPAVPYPVETAWANVR